MPKKEEEEEEEEEEDEEKEEEDRRSILPHLQQVASTSILIVINYHSAEGEGWPRQKYFQRLVIIFRAGDGVGAIKGDADGIRLSPRN